MTVMTFVEARNALATLQGEYFTKVSVYDKYRGPEWPVRAFKDRMTLLQQLCTAPLPVGEGWEDKYRTWYTQMQKVIADAKSFPHTYSSR